MNTRTTTQTFALESVLDQARDGLLIGLDTEFQGPHTLTIQFAVRLGDDLAVQVYYSPAVPRPPKSFDLRRHLPEGLFDLCGDVLLRPVRTIGADLSPARVLGHLLALDEAVAVNRSAGESARSSARPVDLTLAGHFLPADLLRVFGSDFLAGLLSAADGQSGPVVVQGHKLLAFREARRRYGTPVLEHLYSDDGLHPVRVRTFDTCLPFGKGSLDEHAFTFLGVRKDGRISAAEKAHMRDVFHKRPKAAYAYAVWDALLPLLLAERMREEDRRVYVQLGFPEDAIPAMRPTLGSRVSDLLVRAVARHAAGSATLAPKGKLKTTGDEASAALSRVKALLRKGSGSHIAEQRLSRFGRQSGETHGGLSFSRSPTRFYHAAPGQFADVDLSGCYNRVIASLNLYAGQPVVYDPGSGVMSLKAAIAFLEENAAGRDAWVVKVTGDISAAPNALIPSTVGALTNGNYQSRAARKRARSRKDGAEFDWLYESVKDTGHATLFTDRVEAGIVAWATWLLIQAMPPRLRAEYEALEVETILFYPAKLVAATGPEYDAIVERLADARAPWTATLDLDRLERKVVERLGEDHACLRFPVGGLAEKIAAFRRQARQEHGKGSGAELAWKQQGNTLYGVTASPHLPTHNVVFANVVTATGRALAYAMMMALNGVQLVTDGCSYRRDQIPAGTFADCLASDRDYPINRAAARGPFLDPGEVPGDDAAFTAWYRGHVQRFFGVSGPAYEQLFGLHDLEHKLSGKPERAVFDGLYCDGSANYLDSATFHTG